MKASSIARMATDAVSFDSETHLIQPGLLAPPLVCGSLARARTRRGVLLGKADSLEAFCDLLGYNEPARWFLPRDPLPVIVGANVAYDMLVLAVHAAREGIDLMPAIFAAYQDERVFDIQIAEALHAIAQGHLGKDPRKIARGVPDKQCGLKSPSTGKDARYSLEVCTDLVLGRVDAKSNDYWRLRYALLEGTPLDEWPEEARQYPADDAVNTLEVALAQVGVLPNVGVHFWNKGKCIQCGVKYTGAPLDDAEHRCVSTWARRNLHDHAAQVFASFALHLGAAWGLRTNKAAIDTLEAAALACRDVGLADYIEAGYLRVNDEGGYSEDTAVVKRAVATAYGAKGTCEVCKGSGKVFNKFSKRDPSVPVGKPVQCKRCDATGLVLDGTPVPKNAPTPTNPFGSVKAGRDALIESGHEGLMAYAEGSESDKVIETYAPKMRAGIEHAWTQSPNNPLETGRVSYKGIIQLLPRGVSARLSEELEKRHAKGAPRVYGVRDCIEPRPGWVYYSNDYAGGELVTFSEAAVERVGHSDMGVSLNAGRCVHSELGAAMLGIDYDEMIKRRKAKKTPEGARANAFRQGAKPPNFGFPGGMGAVRLVHQQRESGPDTPCAHGPVQIRDGDAWVRGYKGLRFCVLIGGRERCGEEMVTSWGERPIAPTCSACIVIASRMRLDWKAKWSEADPYLQWHGANVEDKGEIAQLYTGRIRGGVDYCSEANGDFQAFLADIAKRALCRVVFEQYVRVKVDSRPDIDAIYERCVARRARASIAWMNANPKALESRYEGCWSPLYGSRNEVFAHDELFGEAEITQAPDASERCNEVMVAEFRKGCPHHVQACKAEPTLMPKWFKGAEAVFRDNAGNRVDRDHPESKVALWLPS